MGFLPPLRYTTPPLQDPARLRHVHQSARQHANAVAIPSAHRLPQLRWPPRARMIRFYPISSRGRVSRPVPTISPSTMETTPDRIPGAFSAPGQLMNRKQPIYMAIGRGGTATRCPAAFVCRVRIPGNKTWPARHGLPSPTTTRASVLPATATPGAHKNEQAGARRGLAEVLVVEGPATTPARPLQSQIVGRTYRRRSATYANQQS